jgi:L-seryl-tRNA(Ser) seleniumtransferase
VLRERAERLVAELDPSAGASVVELRSTVGGGTLPGETLPSWGVALAVRSADRMIAGLRRGTPRVMARVESGRVMLDLRTVHEDSLDWLPGAIRTALEGLQRR